MRTIQLLLCTLILNLGLSTQAQDYYLYVSDAGGFNSPPWQVLRYNIDGSNPQVFIDNDFFVGEGVGWPQDILFLEDQGVVLISCLVGGRITKHNASTGAYIEDFATVAGGPTRMKIGPDGLLYVLQWSNTDNKVLRFQLDGSFVDEFTDTGITNSIGLDWDLEGNLYVSSYGTNKVTQFDENGVIQGTFIETNLGGPTNIHREDDGNFIVLNWNTGNIQRFDSQGTHLGTFTTEVTQPEGIAIHPSNGNYLIGNGGPARIDAFDADGTFVNTVIEEGAGGLVQPNAVVVREATLAVGAYQKEEVMVTPTIGNYFNLHQLAQLEISSLKAYTIMGQQVAIVPLDGAIWNASFLSEGLYILKGTNGQTTYTQKIVVKH